MIGLLSSIMDSSSPRDTKQAQGTYGRQLLRIVPRDLNDLAALVEALGPLIPEQTGQL